MLGRQLKYGGTTFFEVYRPSWNNILGKNDAVPNNQCTYTSLTHPWSAGIVKWLSEEILGIKPLEPGFKIFEIVPHLADTISAVSGATPTLQGPVSASFNLKTGFATIAIPGGTRAKRIAIPLGANTVKSFYLNGKLIWKGKPVDATTNNIKVYGGYLNIEGLGPGDYKCRVVYDKVFKTKPAANMPWNYVINNFKQDSLTSGKWKDHYGKDGFVLLNSVDSAKNPQKLPAYIASVVLRNEAKVHSTLIRDNRVLTDTAGIVRGFGAAITQDPVPLPETMTIDINVNNGDTHQLALYFLDWDKAARRSALEIFDGKTYKLLAPVQMIRNYQNGKYLVFKYSESIRIRINQVRGPNAALSGVFFDKLK